MNNKPVAWIANDADLPLKEDGSYWLYPKNPSKDNLYIPLYTHPVKEFFEDEPQAEELHEIMQSNAELTDEKIDECSCFVDVELSQRYGSIESIDDIDWTITGLRAFARAILLKAQEK